MSDQTPTTTINLPMWISRLGLGSRSEAKTWITEGKVKVNGAVVRDPALDVDPSRDHIFVAGKPLKKTAPPLVYWLLHKPAKLSCSPSIASDTPSIYDLPKIKRLSFRVQPLINLDFFASGLVLVTNDHDLVDTFGSDDYRGLRTYQVLISKKMTPEEFEKIGQGVRLRDGVAKFDKLQYVQKLNLGVSTGAWYIVQTTDGRRKLLQRVFESINAKVVKHIMVGLGPLQLPAALKPGQYVQLTSKEIRALRKSAEASSTSSSSSSSRRRM